MNKKIDIRQIHNNFEHILFERDMLHNSNSSTNKIDELDSQLKEIIISGIHSGIAFSDRMNNWRPYSASMLTYLESECIIHTENGEITFFDALEQKVEKERKFKNVQNWSMLVCTLLLFLYYIIVGLWL